MSVTAGKVDDWYLDEIDPSMEIYPVKEGGKSSYWKRETYILTMSRKFAKMTAFYEEVGSSKSSFSYKTGGGASSTYSSTGKKWMCTKDRVVINDTITGEGLETQVWEYIADPVKMAGTEYQVTDPV
jgi:hypothetical protein